MMVQSVMKCMKKTHDMFMFERTESSHRTVLSAYNFVVNTQFPFFLLVGGLRSAERQLKCIHLKLCCVVECFFSFC